MLTRSVECRVGPGEAEASRTCDAPTRTRPSRDTSALLAVEFEELHALVHRYLLHRFFDPELADELTSQTFCKAAAAIDRFRGDSSTVRIWLLRLATNLANTRYRKRRLQSLIYRDLATTGPAFAASPGSGESGETHRVTRVRRVLLALRPKYQTVVVLRYYSRMPISDIARVTGCREAAVRTRLSRAINEMRERLGT